MFKFLNKLFCKHKTLNFVRNVYGDEIIYQNCRSIWKCDKCGKFIRKMELRHG